MVDLNSGAIPDAGLHMKSLLEQDTPLIFLLVSITGYLLFQDLIRTWLDALGIETKLILFVIVMFAGLMFRASAGDS